MFDHRCLTTTMHTQHQMLSAKFAEMLPTLVSFHGEPVRMQEQIVWLAFRHIQYGARPQHAKVMGDVILETISRAVGDEWTVDMAMAWADLWNSSCEAMMIIIGMQSSCICMNL
jgi:hemoglobin-like flavoprotein